MKHTKTTGTQDRNAGDGVLDLRDALVEACEQMIGFINAIESAGVFEYLPSDSDLLDERDNVRAAGIDALDKHIKTPLIVNGGEAIRAPNAHDDLLAACEQWLLLEDERSQVTLDVYMERIDQAIEQTREAVAKTKGEV